MIRAHLLLQLRTNLDTRLTLGFVDYLSQLPYDFFQRRSTGDLMMRVNNNATLRELQRRLGMTMVVVTHELASIAEIAIKVAQGRFDVAPERIVEAATSSGYAELPVASRHAARLASMPMHHRDPFDRLLVAQALRAEGRYGFFTWTFASASDDVSVEGRIEAPPERFVGLPYDNPPGGRKTCINTKLARCALTLRRVGRKAVELTTASRAAFEILTDRDDHGVPVLGV